jgi:hypothetical protein
MPYSLRIREDNNINISYKKFASLNRFLSTQSQNRKEVKRGSEDAFFRENLSHVG